MNASNVTPPEDLKRLLEPEYLLRRVLGSGAFGDVFEAIQTSTEQLVAIKVLRATETESARKRFRMEMRACAALHHPHIVRVVDAGREDSDSSTPLYTVFEYVPGENLADRIARDGMLPVEEALSLMLQVLDALQAAHRLGIVHRDLKPANIMVIQGTGSLQAKVLDFGISAWLQSTRDIGPRLTQSGERIGTPAYCAPEQLRGEPTAIQVDYYAWGLVLLECLTGKHPFGPASMHEVLHAQFSNTPVPIPKLIAEHPLGDLLRWTLEKDPSRRASDPQYLANRLRRLNLKALCDEAGYLLGNGGGDDEWRANAAGTTEVAGLGRVRTERRPLTALCCRMALGHGLDVESEEALDEWLDDLRDTIVQIAQRNGGRLMGSGGAELIVYFGLEASGEAGARRAARAALEIRDHCARRSNLMAASIGWKIDVRFGMHQGRVTTDSNEVSTLSTTAMIASRLCQLATPGDIAVSQTAIGLLLGLRKFDQQPPDPVLGSLVWYQLSSEMVDDVARSSGGDALTPFTVGRDSEFEKLERVWLGEAGFSVRCVVIQGPAGIGKSHLSTVWQRGLAAKGCEILEARCLPETHGSALYPILRILRERVGLDAAEPSTASNLLARYLAEHGLDPKVNMPLLCPWLGLDSTAWPDQPLSPKKKRDQLLALMVTLIGRLVPSPSVLVIEDAHWADPTTLEWMSMLVDVEHDRRPLLACTLRTEQSALDSTDPPSGVRQHHPSLSALLSDPRTLIVHLDPLNDAASRQLLEGLWGAGDKTTLLVERGAGVPLFLLELVRCGVANRDFVVPPSIAEVLTLRIDQLGDAKETAQLAAVVGPEFDSALMSGLSQRGSELLGDLNRLQNAGIVRHLGDGRYSFSHALLHRSAYESLPGKDRRRLHGGVVSFLGARHPELQTTKPWLFALHHHGAGQIEQALTFGESAATQAVVHFHNFEALSYVRELKGARADMGGGWLAKLDDDTRQSSIELRLLALEATALMLTRGWSDFELSRACERAEQLFPQVAEIETLQMRYVLAQFYFSSGWAASATSGDDERAHPWIESLIQAATTTETVVFRSLGLMMLSAWQFFQGKIASSIETASSIERFPDPKDAWKFGYDAVLCARSIESQARWFRGDPNAHEFSAETLRLAEAFAHPATLANVQLYSLTQLQLAGDRAGTLQRCQELLSLCERSGIQGFPAYALIFKGWAEGNPALAKGMFDALIGAGQRLCEVFCGTIVAEAVLDSGSAAEAEELLIDLTKRAAATGERFILPQILRLRARGLRAQDPLASDRLLAQASEIAIAQGAYGMNAVVTAERARLDAVG